AKLERYLLNGQHHPLTIKGHEYTMYDHGLFIASIVRSIAPTTRVTLMEVLNHKGVGTLKSLAEGFNKIIENRSRIINVDDRPPLIINCSFTFALPVDLYYRVEGKTVTLNMLSGASNAQLIEGITRFRDIPREFVQHLDAAQNAFVAQNNPSALPQQEPF